MKVGCAGSAKTVCVSVMGACVLGVGVGEGGWGGGVRQGGGFIARNILLKNYIL